MLRDVVCACNGACFENFCHVNVVTRSCNIRKPVHHPNRSAVPSLRAGLALPALPEHPNVLIQDHARAPSPGLILVAIQTGITVVHDPAPIGKSPVLALTALTTAARDPRVHHLCLTGADTMAAGAHTAMTPKKTRTVMVMPGPIQILTHVWVCLD